jgi:hypothetical protein
MYLEMIFWNNKDQTMRQLQFKSDPLPYKIVLVQFCNKYIIGPSQKNSFWAFKNGNLFFCSKKMKTSLSNNVCHSKMHPCAQYEIIQRNYAMNVAIWLIIWLESHESSHMIAHLDNTFLKESFYYKFIIFLVTWSHTMTQCEGFPIFWFFFNFLCLFQNGVKTAGMTVPN